VRGHLTERELTSWAHNVIGDEGPEDIVVFAHLDHSLDLVESGAAPTDTVVSDLRAAIDVLLASDPRE
jgi:hypothetical protein